MLVERIKKLYKIGGVKYLFLKLWDKIFKTEKARNYIDTYYKKMDSADYPKAYKKMYKRATGKRLDLKNPTTYREKMQWAKLYDSTEIKTRLSDKILVRDWVKQKVGEKYLVPIYGVWDSFDDIDFDKLPEAFVLKANHGSRMNLIVKDKSGLNLANAKELTEQWLATNYAYRFGMELHYKDILPRLYAEKLLEAKNGELPDYKFLCFNGKPCYCWVDIDRFTDHCRNIYDMQWNLQPWSQGYKTSDKIIEKPKGFDKMVEIASKLCEDFSHVRVDLYDINGDVYFGEMTFTNGSGYEKVLPEKYDRLLGEMWKLK